MPACVNITILDLSVVPDVNNIIFISSSFILTLLYFLSPFLSNSRPSSIAVSKSIMSLSSTFSMQIIVSNLLSFLSLNLLNISK